MTGTYAIFQAELGLASRSEFKSGLLLILFLQTLLRNLPYVP